MSEQYIESSMRTPSQKDPLFHQMAAENDSVFETPLRPGSLSEFSGQDSARERLEVLIGAAKQRGETLGHCLFSGPPGLGKTTLATILAKAMGSNLIVAAAPILERTGDLAGILTKLGEGDIFFIDELHRLNRSVEEFLYQAMEDYSLDIMLDSGPSARSVRVPLKRFTLAGATTRSGLLTAPLRTRFAFTCRLDYYSADVLETILARSCRILNLNPEPGSLTEIAKRSRGTPRIANNLLRWVRDFAQMRNNNVLNREAAINALHMLAIDEQGLDEMDKKILEVLIVYYEGAPVGLSTLAIAVGEESETIEEVYEPFLIMQGFIKRTPRGRQATPLAYKHMNKDLGDIPDA